MPSSQEEQSSLYKRYYDLVKTFNAVNQDYLQALNTASKNRQMAIEMAIEMHIKLRLDALRDWQKIIFILIFFSVIILIAGLCSLSNQNSQGVNGMIVVGAVIFVLSLSANIWISDHIHSLESKAKEAKEGISNHPRVE